MDNKERAQTEVEAHEGRLREDERSLREERGRRYADKSPFTDANPGRKPGSEPPLTTQREFDLGSGDPDSQVPSGPRSPSGG